MKKQISLFKFFKTWKFSDINFWDNKEKIIKNFWNPWEYWIWKCDDWTEILNYWDLEFYFFENKLFQIFSDWWFKEIYFWKNIICDFWILKNLSRCTLKYFLKKLEKENINFEMKKNSQLKSIEIILENWVILHFESFKKFSKENNYKISAFYLIKYE